MNYLNLKRKYIVKDATIGELYYCTDNNSSFICHTLEDLIREIKIQGKTAIPAGEYIVILDYSPKFKQIMPHILKEGLKEIDNFVGVRIHWGNYASDTDGCILVGEWDQKSNFITNSKQTFKKVYQIIKENVEKNKEIKLIIENKIKGGI